jgi:hypothetical protein
MKTKVFFSIAVVPLTIVVHCEDVEYTSNLQKPENSERTAASPLFKTAIFSTGPGSLVSLTGDRNKNVDWSSWKSRNNSKFLSRRISESGWED